MKNIICAIIMLFSIQYGYTQVGIGTTTPDPSSILDIESNSQGVLLPRLTTAQRNAIVSPANGLLFFNSDLGEIQLNIGNTITPYWAKTSRNASVKYSNNATDTAQNINSNTAANAPIISTLEWNDNTTLYNANIVLNTITVTTAGRYKIVVNMSLITSTGTARLSPEIWIEINGAQRGTYASTGYIRNNNGHRESSLHITEVFELNANDVISVSHIRTANAGTVNLRSTGSSNIYIEKI
jgi:hypothetical protein